MRQLIGVAVLLIAGLVPSIGYSSTWYVTVDGSGGAPTIQAAVDSAAPGDTILVAAGIYDRVNQGVPASLRLVAIYKEVHLCSKSGPELTTLDAEGGGGCINVQAFEYEDISPTIDGFSIINGSADFAELGGGIRCWYTSPTIKNNIIRDNWAFLDGGGVVCNESSAVLTHNLIIDNVSATGRGGGVMCANAEVLIANNTLVANVAGAGSGVYCLSSPLTAITNNIITSSSAGAALDCVGGTPTITCNDLWDNADGAGACTLGVNSFSEDPMFCDPSSFDYHIHEDSPCAPGNAPGGCELVGALPVGCWSVPLGQVGVGVLLIFLAAAGACRIASDRNSATL